MNRVETEAAVSSTNNVTSTRLTEIVVISQWLLNGMRVHEARPTSIARNHSTNARRADVPYSNRTIIAVGVRRRLDRDSGG